ncbi:MAG: LysR substrate-binding domain-containing protein [Azovibrio sp.]|uniref:LysR family transcriptional regulator n=1 Tax=Azovibrio sp. TaxID=1872673 RepID=UPI003C73BB3F
MSQDAHDLILFARTLEAGSFSKAAELTRLPKSTLSRRISGLEERLGEKLLLRSTRRLAVTEFGERILEHARRLQEETDAAMALAQHRQETPRGKLRVALPPDFVELDLTPLLLRFAADYPEVRLDLDLSPRRVDLIAERFDLAVRIATQLPDDGTLVARKLCEFGNGLYASPAYLARYGPPQHPDELAGHVGLALVNGVGEVLPWRLSREAERWEGHPKCPLTSNSLGLQRNLAAHGLGIVGLADRLAQPWVVQGRLQRVLPEWSLPGITVWSITPGRRLLPARTLAFMEMLRDNLAPPRA